MQKRDEQTDARTHKHTHVQKAFYNLPTMAFGHRQEIKTGEPFALKKNNINKNEKKTV